MGTIANFGHAFVLAFVCCAAANAVIIDPCDVLPPPTRYVGDTSTDAQCTDNDLQTAINNTAGLTCAARIIITGEHSYTQQSLSLVNKNVSLIGSDGLCGDAVGTTTVPFRTISGTSGHPVISISGTSKVILQNLTINNGNFSSGEGGGIFFNGVGALTLNTMTIADNQAEYGAGVDMSPSDASTLTIGPNTYIIGNTASQSGGGIRIEGATHLIAVSDQTDIGFNKAIAGYGGGIEVLGPAYADIGSSGYGLGSGGVINNNTAAYGGGIAVFANQDQSHDAIVQMFTTDPERPVSIQDNSATIEGGAVYAKPNDGPDSVSDAVFCAFDFRMDGNIAPEGAAIYLDDDTDIIRNLNAGGTVTLNSQDSACSKHTDPSALGAVPCAADAACNELSTNKAQDAMGNPNGGSVLFVASLGAFHAQKMSFRNNSGAHLITGNADAPVNGVLAHISESLIANNTLKQEPFLFNNSDIELYNCTVANNVSAGATVFNVSSTDFVLRDTIIFQPGQLTLNEIDSDSSTIENVISNDVTTLIGSSTFVTQNPMFVDSTNGNYHLLAYAQNGQVIASPAIDFALTVVDGQSERADDPIDLDGNPYGVDVSAVPNYQGTRDLGAYEAQPITDRFFGDSFGDRLSLLR